MEEFVITITLNPEDGGLNIEHPPGQHIGVLGVLDLAAQQIRNDALNEKEDLGPQLDKHRS